MAKTPPFRSAGDAKIKASAQRFDLPKKALRKAVQDATLRLVAERIAREEIDREWKNVVVRSKRRRK